MNVAQSMCAASGPAAQWEQIDWTHCEQRVRRLQACIVKATQEGRHGKVKSDGAVWRSPTARYKAIDTLRRRGYQPQPLRRVYIPKSNDITHIKDGFDFLGQNLRRHGGKVLTTPSKKNMQSFFEKVRGVIRRNDSAKQVNLIGRLNPRAIALAMGEAPSLKEVQCLDR